MTQPLYARPEASPGVQSVSSEGNQTLRISGMTCASCVSTIERALMATPGVTRAVVNLATRTARVEATPELPREALVEAVHRSGYQVVDGRDADAADARAAERKASTRRLMVCVAFTIPLVALAMGPHLLALAGASGSGMDDGGMGGMEGMDMGASDPNMTDSMHAMDETDMASHEMNNESSSMEGMTGMDMPPPGTYESDHMAGMNMDGMDMGGHDAMPAGPDQSMDMAAMGMEYAWIQFLLATPVVVYGGYPFLRGAWKALRNKSLSMDTLVATGMGTAYLYSTGITFVPSWASTAGLYFETAAVIVTLVLVGRRIESRAMDRARGSLQQLIDNGADPELGRFLADAQSSRAGIQRAVDRVVWYFVPTIVIIAIASMLFWFTLGAGLAMNTGIQPQTMAILTLITVLIIACPCGLGLATPLAVMAGTSRGAEQGIFIKGAQAVEDSRRIDTIVLAKTGVVTMGRPEVTDVVPLRGSETELLAVAAAAEAKSDHPLAIAIHRRAPMSTSTPTAATAFETRAGDGVKAIVDGKAILAGRPEWLLDEGVDITAPKAARRLRAQGKTVVAIAQDGILIGLLGIQDAIRHSARNAVKEMQATGLRVILATNDHERTANAIASAVGIDDARPSRTALIQELKQDGRHVAVVAAAIGDSAMLKEAHLGIALGGSSHGAKTDAGIILARDDLADAVPAMDLARRTSRKIHQNLAWAFAYNAVLIPIAAGLLVAWPVFGKPIQLDPMFAAAAMTLSILSVVANSLTLRRWGTRARTTLPTRVPTPEATPA